jgi:putative ABC transport system permease protein
MTRRQLVLRGLQYYWRTHAAVVAGVATAVAVLAGALVVGDSVRGTLRTLALARLGAADIVVTSPRFLRADMATAIAGDPLFATYFSGIAPLIVTEGLVTAQSTGARSGGVLVYGIDDRFWQFHQAIDIGTLGDREALVSPALAAETGATAGDAVLVRVQRPSAIPLESLHSDKDAVGRTIRLTVARVLDDEPLAEFSLRPQQGAVRAVFVPLARLQAELEVGERVNTLVASVLPSSPGTVVEMDRLLREHVAIADVGLKLVPLGDRQAVSVESDAGLLDEPQAAAVRSALDGTALETMPVLTYVANSMAIGDRRVPYSLVTAIDLAAVAPSAAPIASATDPPIVLNQWAADDLGAVRGDVVRLEYYVWEDPGRLATRTANFHVAGIVPVNAADRDFSPSYPGITDSPTMDDWDPPFPVDLARIRRQDEAYWERYRTAPKAFVPLDVGQRLWGSRHGSMTSLRLHALEGRGAAETAAAFEERLRTKIDPTVFGTSIADVRTPALAASAGATDFGEYFLYFSFFLVVAALVLASLFFRLGVEQRGREVGLLRAVGADIATVRALLMGEAACLAVAGALIGLVSAVGYAWLVVAALGTWWNAAVGTDRLTVHVTATSLVIGAVAGIAAALVCTWWTLRSLSGISERSLLAGDLPGMDAASMSGGSRTRIAGAAVGLAVLAVVLSALGWTAVIGASGAFFGAGAALLAAGLSACAWAYRRPVRAVVRGAGWWPVSRLGLRSATYRPGRSVLAIGVVAAATFILIAVDAFRRDAPLENDLQSGTGGYELFVESLLPAVHDPETSAGQQALNLTNLDGVSIERFRLRPGDDASCLNLYQPQDPRILGVSDRFVDAGRFAFHAAIDDRNNAWSLLREVHPDGSIPVIADITSMTYVLHRAVGDEIVIRVAGRPVRLRIVAALRDSVFQSELLMSDANFRAIFPEREGFHVMLVDTPPGREAEISAEIENGLSDLGADATSVAQRLAEYHRVENTYLSTFQTLGGLGLLIGTIGLGAVLVRNVLERRRELALLGAVGYRRRHFVLMLTAESLSLLVIGLVVGALSAALAVAPAAIERGGRLPLSTGGLLLLFVVFVAGLVSTVVAARLATRGPLLAALKAE